MLQEVVFVADGGEYVFFGMNGELRRRRWLKGFIPQLRAVERSQLAGAGKVERALYTVHVFGADFEVFDENFEDAVGDARAVRRPIRLERPRRLRTRAHVSGAARRDARPTRAVRR